MNRSTLDTAFTIVLVLCALTVTGLVVRQQFGLAPATPRITDVDVVHLEAVRSLAYSIAAPAAPDTVIEFTDFTCRYCIEAYDQVRRMRGARPFVHLYVHFPLRTDGAGYVAAMMAECATRYGRLAEMHGMLFERSELTTTGQWDDLLAMIAPADSMPIAACMRDSDPATTVAHHVSAARAAGVRTTPSYIIHGKLYPGLLRPAEFADIVFDPES